MARAGFVTGAAAFALLLSAGAWLLRGLAPEPSAAQTPPAAGGTAVYGLVVRGETVVAKPEGGTLVLASRGERVSAGGVIAAAAATPEGLRCAVRAAGEAAERECVRRAVYAAAAGRPELAEPLAALYTQGEDEPYELITSPFSALWSPYADGLEYLSAESLADLTPERLEALLELEPRQTEVLGRLVYDGSWYFAALMPRAEAPEEGSRVELRFEGFRARARTAYVSAASGGDCAVVFESREKLREALELRFAGAELCFEAG